MFSFYLFFLCFPQGHHVAVKNNVLSQIYANTPEIQGFLHRHVYWRRQPWGSIWGVFGHTRKSIRKTNAFTIFSRRAAFYACLSSRSYPQCTQITHALDEPRLFWLQEKPEGPQIKPHAGIKMVQVLVSLVYICMFCKESFRTQKKRTQRCTA